MSIEAQGHFLTFFFQVLYVLCLYEAQLSGERLQNVYRTIDPLVSICIDKRHFEKIIGMGHIVSEMVILKYIHK